MKLLFFDDFKLGVLKDDSVVDVSDAVRGIPHTSPHDLINRLIEGFSEYRGCLEEVANEQNGSPVNRVSIRAPHPKP